ncbi:MAG: hypothetical protein ACTSUE_10535 [Promethearchaeota archaeon]
MIMEKGKEEEVRDGGDGDEREYSDFMIRYEAKSSGSFMIKNPQYIQQIKEYLVSKIDIMTKTSSVIIVLLPNRDREDLMYVMGEDLSKHVKVLATRSDVQKNTKMSGIFLIEDSLFTKGKGELPILKEHMLSTLLMTSHIVVCHEEFENQIEPSIGPNTVVWVISRRYFLFQKNPVVDIITIGKLLNSHRLSDHGYLRIYGRKDTIKSLLKDRVIQKFPTLPFLMYHRIPVPDEFTRVMKTVFKTYFNKYVLPFFHREQSQKVLMNDYKFLGEQKGGKCGHVPTSWTNIGDEYRRKIKHMFRFLKICELFLFDTEEARKMMIKHIGEAPLITRRNRMIKLDYLNTLIVQMTAAITKSKFDGLILIVFPDVNGSITPKIARMHVKVGKGWNITVFSKKNTTGDCLKWAMEGKLNKGILLISEQELQSKIPVSCSWLTSRITEIHTLSSKHLYSPHYQHALVSLLRRDVKKIVHIHFGKSMIEEVMVSYLYRRKSLILQEMRTSPEEWIGRGVQQLTSNIPLIEILEIPLMEKGFTTSTLYDTAELTPIELIKLISEGRKEFVPLFVEKGTYPLSHGVYVKPEQISYGSKIIAEKFVAPGFFMTDHDFNNIIELLFNLASIKKPPKTFIEVLLTLERIFLIAKGTLQASLNMGGLFLFCKKYGETYLEGCKPFQEMSGFKQVKVNVDEIKSPPHPKFNAEWLVRNRFTNPYLLIFIGLISRKTPIGLSWVRPRLISWLELYNGYNDVAEVEKIINEVLRVQDLAMAGAKKKEVVVFQAKEKGEIQWF